MYCTCILQNIAGIYIPLYLNPRINNKERKIPLFPPSHTHAQRTRPAYRENPRFGKPVRVYTRELLTCIPDCIHAHTDVGRRLRRRESRSPSFSLSLLYSSPSRRARALRCRCAAPLGTILRCRRPYTLLAPGNCAELRIPRFAPRVCTHARRHRLSPTSKHVTLSLFLSLSHVYLSMRAVYTYIYLTGSLLSRGKLGKRRRPAWESQMPGWGFEVYKRGR